VGRIEYVKFTSVNLDYHSYIYFIYLNKNNQQDKTKKPDIGHTNAKFYPRAIWSPLHVLPAEFFIFLNFVLKIQIQYFLESECITNTWKTDKWEKFNEKEAFDPLVAGLHGLFVFLNLSQEIRTNPRSFFIRPLIFAPNLNHSNQICEKQLTGRCNFWHTHDICTLKTHTHTPRPHGGGT